MRKLFLPDMRIFLIAIWVMFSGAYTAFAQEAMEQLNHIIPPSPDAAALGRATDVPVSLYTGMPHITIPIWTLKGDAVSVPLSLSYQSNGLKVSDIPGWTGLGWSLNAGGSVTRSVRGNPDDLTHGYLNNGHTYLHMLHLNTENLWKWQPPGVTATEKIDFLHQVAAGYIDLEPDIFYFNFNGHTGEFVLDPEGKPVMITPADLEIRMLKDPAGKIVRWDITDEGGVKYIFGGNNAVEQSTHLTSNGYPGPWFYSTWHLSQIIPPNREEIFSFHYFSRTVTYRYPVPLRKRGCRLPSRDDLFRYTQTTIEEKHLSEIIHLFSGNAVSVKFEADTLGGFPGGEILALKKITVVHPQSDRYNKTFTFDYSFFPATGCGTEENYLYPCKRLRLDRVTESAGGQHKPPYRFFYDPQPLPSRGSFSQDYWGYYNGKKNETPVPALRVINNPVSMNGQPPVREDGAVNFRWFTQANLNIENIMGQVWELPGGDLTPDPAYARAGILNRIVYPTGGETLLEYEPNRAGYIMMPEKPLIEKFLDHPGSYHAYSMKIPYDQRVTLIPLFYKTVEQATIADDSRLIIVCDSVGFDVERDTLFSLTYKQVKEEAGGYGAEYPLWMKKGTYRIYTEAPAPNSMTGCIAYVHKSAVDKVYRVYSHDYKSARVQAGLPYFPDDSSYRIIEPLHIGEEDDSLLHIQYYFRSLQHPNVIPRAGLPIPATLVRITPASGGDPVFINEYTEHDSLDWNQTVGYFKQGKESVVVSPGDYQVEFYPSISGESGYIRVIYDKAVATYHNALAGGVRLKQKMNLDYARDTIGWIQYDYQSRVNNSEWSSGVLMRFPLYYDEPEKLFYLGQLADFSCIPIAVYSNSQTELGATSGSHIGYAEVVERSPKTGKTVYRYTSALEYPDISQPLFPFAPVVTFDWKRGQIQEKTVWSKEGRLRQRTTYEYNDFQDTVYRYTLPAVKVVQKDTGYNAVGYSVYGTQTGWSHPVGKTRYQYDQEGNHPFVQKEKVQYDPKYYKIRETTTYTSDSVPRKVVYTYLTDSAGSSPGVDTLRARHMHNIKIREEAWLDSVKISGYKTFFGLFAGNRIVAPDSVQVLEGKDYHTQAWFDHYDNRGHLLQYHKRGEASHSFNYNDYGLLIARADNASYVASPSAYPPEASVTHYTRDLLLGITSVTDPNGNTTHYDYDPFGRLVVMRDHKNRILKKVTYHYREYKGDTTRPAFLVSQWVYSQPPSGILSSESTAIQGCATTLSVAGGSLGSDAVWHWYTGGCAVYPLDTGNEITVYPQTNTAYYVRAEGKANITSCAKRTLRVEDPTFSPDHDTLFFSPDGTGHPWFILTNYTGCDPWSAQIKGAGFTITEKNDASVGISAEVNPYDTARTGSLQLQGNAIEYHIPIIQAGHQEVPSLSLTLVYQPSFVSPGTEVQVKATVENGSSPYTYTWERKEASETEWTFMNAVTRTDAQDQIHTLAGHESFSVRCTATSQDEHVTNIIVVKVVE